MARGLAATARRWPSIRQGYSYVHRAARILKNAGGVSARRIRRRLGGLLGAMARHRPRGGSLGHALAHFAKVTASYWPGLFACYQIPDLPRTNNDLEHLFGANRYHERRATGRKTASPAMVLRGPVRLVAATATRLHPWTGPELAPTDLQAWRTLRHELDARRGMRKHRFRFRRRPEAYLRQLERQYRQLALPP